MLKALNLPLKAGTPEYQQMLAALSAPLPRHGNLACGSNANAKGCGYLETDSLALIYDENNSAADVFVSKKLVPESGGKTLYYTPTAQTEKSSTMRIFMFLSNSTSKQSLTRSSPERVIQSIRFQTQPESTVGAGLPAMGSTR